MRQRPTTLAGLIVVLAAVAWSTGPAAVRRADLPDRERFDLDQVNALSERGLEEYRRQGYRYAVLSSFQNQRFGGPADTYGELERGARQLASFEPTVDGQELPFDIEALYSPLHDLDRLARPGPTIRIYALETGR